MPYETYRPAEDGGGGLGSELVFDPTLYAAMQKIQRGERLLPSEVPQWYDYDPVTNELKKPGMSGWTMLGLGGALALGPSAIGALLGGGGGAGAASAAGAGGVGLGETGAVTGLAGSGFGAAAAPAVGAGAASAAAGGMGSKLLDKGLSAAIPLGLMGLGSALGPDTPQIPPELREMLQLQKQRFQSQTPLYESVLRLAQSRLPLSAQQGSQSSWPVQDAVSRMAVRR